MGRGAKLEQELCLEAHVALSSLPSLLPLVPSDVGCIQRAARGRERGGELLLLPGYSSETTGRPYGSSAAPC